MLNQQRVLVAINRGEACEVVLPASPLLNAVQWQCKEGHGQLTDGILALPAISGYGMDELTFYNALCDACAIIRG
ncbi:maltodextrin glucosidase [Escherichia coli]|uniref:Maltodextrin glucosidase n=1 Tax=Escherichia coli TaxID=562 RepID=A0A377AZ29_ECOLX|nr:maltodextrin glucosidase [Escherichia coli]